MCAIVGCISSCRGPDLERGRLQRATESLAHRGPDGLGICLHPRLGGRGRVGLGHCRLAVNGGPSAQQPIFHHDQSIAVVVNGELYDPGDQQRRRLQQLGHRWTTNSDSELALHLYVHYGIEFVHHLRGEFAILIDDRRQDRLIAVRDRFGIKPLVYTQHDGETWFASQSRAFAAAGLPIEFDHESIWHTFSFQYTLPDRTLYRNVKQLPAGYLAIAQADQVFTRCYWDVDYPGCNALPCDQDRCSDEDRIEQFSERFDEAVRIRVRGDVPVVSHLSGGIDSCSVLESAVRQGGVAAAYSIGFPGEVQHDETEHAAALASALSIPMQVIDGSPIALLENIERAAAVSESWTVNGHLAAKFMLSRAIAADGYKVALTGEGADELLAGYAHLKMDHCQQESPQWIRQIRLDNQTSFGTMIPLETRFGHSIDQGWIKTDAIESMMGYVPTFVTAKACQGRMIWSHLKPEFLHAFAGRDPMQEWSAAVLPSRQIAGRSRLHQSLYFWIKSALAQNILKSLGDGCEAAHGTEGRLPMLDHQLFEWVRQQPISALIRNPLADGCGDSDGPGPARLIEKWLLRAAMLNRLPCDVVNRAKHPFDAPPLANRIQSHRPVREFIESKIEQHPFFDENKVRETLMQMENADQSTRTAVDPLWWMLICSKANAADSLCW